MKRDTRLKTTVTRSNNLNTDLVEEDLNQLFGIRSTKYLQETTCSIEMPVNQKAGKNKGFGKNKGLLQDHE